MVQNADKDRWYGRKILKKVPNLIPIFMNLDRWANPGTWRQSTPTGKMRTATNFKTHENLRTEAGKKLEG